MPPSRGPLLHLRRGARDRDGPRASRPRGAAGAAPPDQRASVEFWRHVTHLDQAEQVVQAAGQTAYAALGGTAIVIPTRAPDRYSRAGRMARHAIRGEGRGAPVLERVDRRGQRVARSVSSLRTADCGEGASGAVDDAGALEVSEPGQEQVRPDSRELLQQLPLAPRRHEELADDQQGPAFPHHVQRGRVRRNAPDVAAGKTLPTDERGGAGPCRTPAPDPPSSKSSTIRLRSRSSSVPAERGQAAYAPRFSA
jgi:hypothetical protein